MSDIQTVKTHIMPLETYAKPSSGFRMESKTHLLPTRSNTPEEISPISFKSDNYSDRDSSAEASTPTATVLSSSGSFSSLDSADSSSFEIDVRPKRRKFNTAQERLLFVEEYKRKYKTEMCKNWELRGTCKFGDKCCFAHGKHELKDKALTHVKYKTKPCKQYHQSSYCPYGQRCQYLHREALVPNIFFKPQEDKLNQGSYTYEQLHDINVLCNTDADVNNLLDCLPQR